MFCVYYDTGNYNLFIYFGLRIINSCFDNCCLNSIRKAHSISEKRSKVRISYSTFEVKNLNATSKETKMQLKRQIDIEKGFSTVLKIEIAPRCTLKRIKIRNHRKPLHESLKIVFTAYGFFVEYNALVRNVRFLLISCFLNGFFVSFDGLYVIVNTLVSVSWS